MLSALRSGRSRTGRIVRLLETALPAVICSSAGYNPSALGRVLTAIGTVNDRTGPGFWQTHPSPEDRLAALGEVQATLPASETDPARTARFQGNMVLHGGSSGSTSTEPDDPQQGSARGQ